MKYYFKESFRLLYADGTIYDENGLPVYTYENQTLFCPRSTCITMARKSAM